MNKNICFFLLILLYPVFVQAQGIVVKDVTFTGGQNFNQDFLYAQITNKAGSTYNIPSIEADIQRLRQLSGALNATYRIDSSDASQCKIIYDIESRGTLKPILGLGGIKNNFWFTAGISEFNLNGKNQILEAYYLNNDSRHNGKLFFQNEKIKGGNWGFSIDAARLATREPLFFSDAVVNYNYTNHAVGGNVIRWLDRSTILQGGLTFFKEEYDKLGENIQDLPGPIELTQNKALFKIIYKKNKITYDYFYRGGYSSELILLNVQTFGDDTQFYSASYEVKKFIRTKRRSNLALRFKAAIATNNDSPFAPFVLDSNFNIRGVGNRVDRGTAQAVLNVEYRHTVRQRGPWAIQGVLFSDCGTWRSPGAPLSDLWRLQEVQLFLGAGFRIVYTKHIETTLRVDYGIDAIDKGQGGLVVGIGQYF